MNMPPHDTARPVRGLQLWITRAEFGGAVLFGAIFVALSFVVIGTWSHFETKKQAESFTLAVTTLAREPDLEPLTQRKAVLLKRDGSYHWRAIVWRRNDAAKIPLIWTARIREAKPMIVEETSLSPYEQNKAWDLELYDEVAP